MATGSDIRSRELFGVPLGVRMRNHKLRNIRPSGAFSPEVPFGCSLGRLRPISSMATGTSPFTGYLPLSRHFISTFNKYISYKSLLFSDMFAMYSK
jgi:hypothetical protein